MLTGAKYFYKKLSSQTFRVCLAAMLTVSQVATAEDIASTDNAAFQKWLQDVRIEALTKGISNETIALALSDVKLLKRVIKKDNSQPEVKQTYAAYFKARVSEWRIAKGQKMLAENAELFAEIAEVYGVQPRFIAAIWGMETNYGTYDLTIPVFDAIATLAYNPRRAARFRSELFAALKILEDGDASIDIMKGSWAGAMGQPQFMPQTYVAYAKDHDGDGVRDIWTNKGDVFASIASYLKRYGWKGSQTWGREIQFTDSSEADFKADRLGGSTPDVACKSYKDLGAWRSLSEWQEKGIRRLNGDELPKRNLQAALILGDSGDNKGYLVYRNFCSIMKYNPSFKYALGVSMLAEKIKGAVK